MESSCYHYLHLKADDTFVNAMDYLLIICHDDLSLVVGEQYIHAQAGDLCLVHGHQSLQFLVNQSASVSCLALSTAYCHQCLQTPFYQLPIFYDFFQLEPEQEDSLFFRSSNQPKLQKTVALLMEEAQQEGDSQGVVVYHLLLVLFHQLHQVHQEILSISDSTMMPHRLAGAFLKYMEEHMQDITIESMAQNFGYHPTYFSKVCQQLLKTTFSEKIRQLRFERTCELLVHSPLAIGKIMTEVGYRDLGHFHRSFKQQFGCTPLQYRKLKTSNARPLGQDFSIAYKKKHRA